MAVSPGAQLLHLRYIGIKLPPAGFLSLKRVRKNQPKLLNVSERVHLYPQAQSQVPSLLLFPSRCFSSVAHLATETCLLLHCVLSAAYGTAVLD